MGESLNLLDLKNSDKISLFIAEKHTRGCAENLIKAKIHSTKEN